MPHSPLRLKVIGRPLALLLVVTGLQLIAQAVTVPTRAVTAPVVDAPSLLHGNGARLTWRRATDADFVRYEVHRSTSPGFSTATDATKLVEIGYRPLTMFTDTTAKGGTTYYYKIVVITGSGRAESEVTAALPATGTSKLVVPATDEIRATTIGTAAGSAMPACGDDTNWGATDEFYVGADATWIQRGLLRFDLRDIPAKSTVTSADLTLSYVGTTTTDTGVEAHRVTQQWSEGSNTEPGCSSGAGATWREAAPGVHWRSRTDVSPGAEFANGATLPAQGTHDRSTDGTDVFHLAPMVQNWVDGAANFGLLLKQATENRAAPSLVAYHSDDAATGAARPQLVVTWDDPSKTSTSSFQVSTTSPVANQTVSGTTRLGADASSTGSQVSVTYFIDGNQVGQPDVTPPFTYDWASTSVPDGTSHTFRADATNAAGQVKSSSVTFAVDNSPAPTGVTIQTPTAATTVSGNVTVSATAADDTGVKDVALTVNGTVVARDSAAPWSMVWDTRDPLLAGYRGTSYVLVVEATDTSGRTTESAPRTVYVDNDTSTNKRYRATFGLNAYGTSTAAFELPPAIDTTQQTTTSSTEATSTGDGNLGTKSLAITAEPTCDACATTATSSTTTSTATTSATTPQALSLDAVTQSVIATPAEDDGGALPSSGGGGGGGGNGTKALADGSFRLDVDVTNGSTVAWKSGGPGAVGLQLWYRWINDDGKAVYEAPGNAYFPNNLKAGASQTIPVLVRQPPLQNGAERDRLRLRFDIFDSESLTWFADRGNRPVEQPVIVNHALAGNLGLERYWQYEQVSTGAGSSAMVNVSNGNLLWRYSPWSTPGRGIATLLDLTYNSLEEHSDSPAGENVWVCPRSG